ncbi:hypothetical protein [Pseudosulfitobacter sp. DSM 107133]|jgi:hypothetical protein|uniref:hypothetical protein n=1 Tax=Pseudosulfitobacter sp. DSM 107133 TaxID=2883100 RepID=UPI00196656A1|nr:hypothetical protein [Pseudosulfitobacter sp. DSM 107133]UOA26803.1 hypothetical protein DSM107133_01509 [Pseudosulfitobacter sp. DSM 107133]
MKITGIAATLALVLAPVFAVAEGCGGMKEQQAMSCADGSNFDHATGTCIPVST